VSVGWFQLAQVRIQGQALVNMDSNNTFLISWKINVQYLNDCQLLSKDFCSFSYHTLLERRRILLKEN
jgi:hypothetical protein